LGKKRKVLSERGKGPPGKNAQGDLLAGGKESS